MIALLWKELRENLKWALLAAVVLAALELHTVSHYENGGLVYQSNVGGVTLCRKEFLLVTTFGPPIIGFLLGLLQVLPELNRDRWAALLHRPASRGVIFFGKAAAGVLLYVVAAGLPFLLCLWLVATPGHLIAPYVPGLELPGAADTCAGLLYYFAGLLAALPRGGSPALRVLPLLAAIHVSFFVTETDYFAPAISAVALMAAALCTAAWGTMLHQELFRARPWLGQITLLAVAFYGVCGFGDLVAFGYRAGYRAYGAGSQYNLSDAGEPLKVTYAQGLVVAVQTLDGRPVEDPNAKPDRLRNHVLYPQQCSPYIGDPHGSVSHWPEHRYRESFTYIWPLFPVRHPRHEQWFYLFPERVAIGRLPDRKATIGFLDGRGFQPASAHPVPMGPEIAIGALGNEYFHLHTRDGVRIADLAQKKITDLKLSIAAPVYGVVPVWARTLNQVTLLLAVAGSNAMEIFSVPDWQHLATLPYDKHKDLDRWGCLEIATNGAADRFYLGYKPSAWIPWKQRLGMPAYLEEFNTQGQVLHTYTLPPLPLLAVPRNWMDFVAEAVKSPTFFFGTLLYEKAGAEFGDARLEDALALQLGDNWKQTKETAIVVSILSIILAAVTFWWARRYQFSWQGALKWAAFSLAFNVAGLIVFRLVADWPRLVRCSVCQKRRPIDSENCPKCGGQWPETKLNGTEIFDSRFQPADQSTASV